MIYEFKHALVQDAAYNSLLRSKRLQFHREIGEGHRGAFSGDHRDQAGAAGLSFREAALPAKAFPYAMRAGEEAVRRALRRDRSARALPGGARPRALAAALGERLARADRGHAQARERRPEPAPLREDLKNLEQTRSLAEALNDRRRYAGSSTGSAGSTTSSAASSSAVEIAGKALLIAEGLGGGDEDTADPVNLLGRVQCLRGEPPEAITYSARNVQQMRRLGNRIEEAAMSGVLAFAYGMHGEFDRAPRRRIGIRLAARSSICRPRRRRVLLRRGARLAWRSEVAVPGVRRGARPVRQAPATCSVSTCPRLARPGPPDGGRPRRGRGRPRALHRARRPDRHDLPSRRLPGLSRQGASADGDVGEALRDSTEALQVAGETRRPGAARSRCGSTARR